jgi:hypothetical protein
MLKQAKKRNTRMKAIGCRAASDYWLRWPVGSSTVAESEPETGDGGGADERARRLSVTLRRHSPRWHLSHFDKSAQPAHRNTQSMCGLLTDRTGHGNTTPQCATGTRSNPRLTVQRVRIY